MWVFLYEEYNGWAPTSDTLLWLPFTEDALDHSQYEHTVTVVNWNNFSFDTFSNGGGCMRLNPSSTQTYFSISWNDLLWDYNTSATWAWKISEAVVPSGSDSWAATAAFWYNTQLQIWYLDQTTSSWYNSNNLRVPNGPEWYWSSSSYIEYDSSDVRCTGTTVRSVIITFDANTKVMKSYLDNTLFYERDFTAWPSRTANQCVIWKNLYANDPRRCLNAKTAHIVYELWVWDSDRISKYVELL